MLSSVECIVRIKDVLLSDRVFDCAKTGSQRCEVLEQARMQARELKWCVRILADAETPRLPRVVRANDCAHWGCWAWRVSDAWALADMACRLFAQFAPEACSPIWVHCIAWAAEPGRHLVVVSYWYHVVEHSRKHQTLMLATQALSI